MNYGCILCTEHKCPHSPCWEIPEEDLEIYKQHNEKFRRYIEEHNPDMEQKINKIIDTFNSIPENYWVEVTNKED
jgi:hypothetical protein